jgi:hypothetical protein
VARVQECVATVGTEVAEGHIALKVLARAASAHAHLRQFVNSAALYRAAAAMGRALGCAAAAEACEFDAEHVLGLVGESGLRGDVASEQVEKVEGDAIATIELGKAVQMSSEGAQTADMADAGPAATVAELAPDAHQVDCTDLVWGKDGRAMTVTGGVD